MSSVSSFGSLTESLKVIATGIGEPIKVGKYDESLPIEKRRMELDAELSKAIKVKRKSTGISEASENFAESEIRATLNERNSLWSLQHATGILKDSLSKRVRTTIVGLAL